MKYDLPEFDLTMLRVPLVFSVFFIILHSFQKEKALTNLDQLLVLYFVLTILWSFTRLRIFR